MDAAGSRRKAAGTTFPNGCILVEAWHTVQQEYLSHIMPSFLVAEYRIHFWDMLVLMIDPTLRRQ